MFPTSRKSGIAAVLASMKASETYDLPSNWKTRRWQDLCLADFRKKHRLAHGSYFTYLVSAGVGSGKTLLSGLISAYLLNKGDIDRVIYVCPNRAIRRRVIEDFRRLNIHLATGDRAKHRDGESSHLNGMVLTYSALIRHAEAQGKLCDLSRTLVVFDEIHHLGDELPWGESTKSAFEFRAACVLGLSGTPYRIDNRAIPFVKYDPVDSEGMRIFAADFTYTLGKSILDGVCRRPVFHWLDGDVSVKVPDGSKVIVTFKEELPINLANRRLNGAVRAGSASRSQAIHRAIEFCRRTHRKLIIFVGGDSSRKDGGGVRDASEFLPAELRSHGIRASEMCFVVAEDKDAPAKIAGFGDSEAWILIAVNMVSEGVDIPALSAALFLTSITARATTIQRIGRALRGEGEAHIFMFGDSRYQDVGKHIETQINHEIEIGKATSGPAPTSGIKSERTDEEPVSIGLNCREDGKTINGVFYSSEVERKYWEVIRERGLPEGQAFMSILFPLIADGAYGPLGGQR